jgi:hypothetical protein
MNVPALLDELHERCLPGGLVGSRSGHVLASPARLAAPPERLGVADRTAVPTAGAAAEAFADGLLALHAAVLADALGHAVAHLRERVSEGASLLNRPQLQADLADAALAVHEYRVGYLAGSGAHVRWACHRRLTGAGRTVLRLLGAGAMLTDGPAPDLHLAEVAGNVYLHPGLESDDVD